MGRKKNEDLNAKEQKKPTSYKTEILKLTKLGKIKRKALCFVSKHKVKKKKQF